MTTNIGSSTSFPAIAPALTEVADIQVALRLLAYGTSSDPANNAAIQSNSIFGKLKTLTSTSPVTVTATTHTVDSSTTFLVFNTSATCTVTLPTAATYPGRILWVKNIAAYTVNSASSNVKPLASNTAGTSILAATAGKFAQLVSDGSNWIVMSAN